MGLRDRLGSMFQGKGSEPPPPPGSAFDTSEIYAGIKKADEDLYVAAMHLRGLADDVLDGRNPDASAVKADITTFCNQAATDWILAHYSLAPGLAQEYGKGWQTENAREMFETVCKASAVADREVAAALKTSMELIAIAACSMLIHGLFAMMRNPESETATRNAVEATASAKTYILGL